MKEAFGGEIFIPKILSYRIIDKKLEKYKSSK